MAAKRSLNTREKRLLGMCLGVIFIVINVLAFREYTLRRKALTESLKSLKEQVVDDRAWVKQRAFWEKRSGWLDKHMPYTDSAGRSQGQLLDELQNSALDAQLKVTNQTLHAAADLDHCKEVSLSLRINGDQEVMMHWLLAIQSPEKFEAMKGFDLQLDTRSKEKRPQAECNLTIAQWFNPEKSASAEAAASNPLETPDPLSAK